jgi:hypothetical protein
MTNCLLIPKCIDVISQNGTRGGDLGVRVVVATVPVPAPRPIVAPGDDKIATTPALLSADWLPSAGVITPDVTCTDCRGFTQSLGAAESDPWTRCVSSRVSPVNRAWISLSQRHPIATESVRPQHWSLHPGCRTLSMKNHGEKPARPMSSRSLRNSLECVRSVFALNDIDATPTFVIFHAFDGPHGILI